MIYNEHAVKFTELEYDKFREAFKFFDKHGENMINTDDVSLALRAMGALVTGKEVKVLVAKYDPTSSGRIHFDEFVAMLGEVLMKYEDPSTIRNAFSSFDKSDRGMLSIEEMKYVMTRIGDTLSPEEATNFFNILDSHGDGFVRMDELIELL